MRSPPAAGQRPNAPANLGTVIVGSGIDILEIVRIERALARGGERLRERLFTEREQADCARRGRPAPHYAIRFAVKEAGMKAIGTGWSDGVAWRDFELIEASTGLELQIHGRARELALERSYDRAWVGASHNRTHAIAQVVLERSSVRA